MIAHDCAGWQLRETYRRALLALAGAERRVEAASGRRSRDRPGEEGSVDLDPIVLPEVSNPRSPDVLAAAAESRRLAGTWTALVAADRPPEADPVGVAPPHGSHAPGLGWFGLLGGLVYDSDCATLLGPGAKCIAGAPCGDPCGLGGAGDFCAVPCPPVTN